MYFLIPIYNFEFIHTHTHTFTHTYMHVCTKINLKKLTLTVDFRREF